MRLHNFRKQEHAGPYDCRKADKRNYKLLVERENIWSRYAERRKQNIRCKGISGGNINVLKAALALAYWGNHFIPEKQKRQRHKEYKRNRENRDCAYIRSAKKVTRQIHIANEHKKCKQINSRGRIYIAVFARAQIVKGIYRVGHHFKNYRAAAPAFGFCKYTPFPQQTKQTCNYCRGGNTD